MNKKIKKILTAVVCAAMVLICIINTGAAETTEQQAESKEYSSFKVLDSSKYIPNNLMIYLSTFNQSSATPNIIKFDTSDNPNPFDYYSFKDYYTGNFLLLDSNKIYNVSTGFKRNNGFAAGGGITRDFNNLRGTYQKVRIKLSDFASYFNSDGYHTQTISGETYTYRFGQPEKIGNRRYYSSLVLFSGAAFTSVTPNKNGEVEFYVSTKIGEKAYYTTELGIENTDTLFSIGSTGISRADLPICKGKVITDSAVISISDVTQIQLYLADMLDEEFTDLQKFNADANNDGVIDIKDATYIQLYLAKLL